MQKELGSAMLPSYWLARWNVLHCVPSAQRFLHELADPCLFSGSQLLSVVSVRGSVSSPCQTNSEKTSVDQYIML